MELSNEEDAQSFLDFHKKRYKSTWGTCLDYLFKKEGLLSKKVFFKQLRLNPKKPTVYY